MAEVEDDLHKEGMEIGEMAEVEDDLHEAGMEVGEKAEVKDDLHEKGMEIGVPAKNRFEEEYFNILFERRGLVQLQLDSFNYFVKEEMANIVRANNVITSEQDPTFYFRYEKVYIGRPAVVRDDVSSDLNPQHCRQRDMTYAAPIYVNVQYVTRKMGEIETQEKDNVYIGSMPVMLKSCCELPKKVEKKIAEYGECPLDPGGYFIIKGKEKVILIQEQLAQNNIIIDTDKKGCVQASVDCCTNSLTSKTIIKMEKEIMYLYLDQFKSKVPIMVVLKAMGMRSHQDVIQMIGNKYIGLMCPSFEDCKVEGVHTQEDAVEFLEKKVKEFPYPNESQKEEPLSILRKYFIAHIPVQGNDLSDFFPKCVYVALMLRQMMDVITDKENVDDKDYVGNKRLELSGQLLSLLFEDLFKKMNDEARKSMDRSLRKSCSSWSFDPLPHVKNQNCITSGLEHALLTGNFGIRRFRRHIRGMTQDLTRMSYIASLGHMTKISPQFEISRKNSGHRALQPSQWGMFCPYDTPVGEACGLVKNLALMTHVTTDEDEVSLSRLCCTYGVEDLISAAEPHMSESYLVILNGKILGKHRKPQEFAHEMRCMRRAGQISKFVSIFVNDKRCCVYIASDGGRVCRPLIIAGKGVLRSEMEKMKKQKDATQSIFEKCLKEGLIEYLDVNEENNALIALFEENAKEGTTHIELEPFTTLGITAGLIPYPHHNQSPRNTYACAMAKQAMGNIAYNQLMRVDSLINLLVYPQKPIVTTRTSVLVHFDELGAGQNATVAVMSYSGYDINDAIVMNKASLDHGFGRCIVMKKLSAVRQTYANGMSDNIIKPDREGYEAEKMQILDDDGIATPGQIIRPDDIYINKQSPIVICSTGQSPGTVTDSQYKSSEQRYKGPEGETAAVDRVALYSDEKKNLCFKFMIRDTRRPEVGDKFSSRHGQKGVCGTIVPQEDLPFSELGICPDLIINPHVFPSRMTVGEIIELLGSKAGAQDYRIRYGSAFGEPSGNTDKVEDLSETLVKHGFSYDGKDLMYSGITGEPLQAYIFVGPLYYQKLKHMVLDKMHAQGIGFREIVTRQPTEGLWVGERDRDCLIAYGGSMLLYERLMLSSDPFEVQVCRKCGLLGYYNFKLKLGMCSTCKNGKNMCGMKLPYACKLLIQELQSMNIVPRLKLREA